MCASRTDGLRIGVDLGGTKIEAALLDGTGEIVRRVRTRTPQHDYPATLEAIREVVEQLERGIDAPISIGVGTPGAISPTDGRIKNANSVWLNGKPLADDLERVLGRELRFANDANCFALSEAVDGAARGAGVVFGAILGTGVGGGIVIERRVLLGPNAIAGEWGHNSLPWPFVHELPGPPCYCGRSGCIETFLSGPGMSRDYEQSSGARQSVEQIVSAAAAGDELAEGTLERYETRLARALAAVINLLDPDAIVLGGGLSNLTRLYDRVPRLWQPFVFSDQVATRLLPPTHGDSSGVRGAAWLW